MKKKEDEVFTSYGDLDDKQMWDLLVSLVNTPYWQALLKFNRMEDAEVMSSLCAIDPFKEPTTMAKTQGLRVGIYRLEDKINLEIQVRKKEENKGKIEDNLKLY